MFLGKTVVSIKHLWKKKIGTNKTANFESGFKTGHLSNMSNYLTFHVNGNQQTAALKVRLYLVGRQVNLFYHHVLKQRKLSV